MGFIDAVAGGVRDVGRGAVNAGRNVAGRAADAGGEVVDTVKDAGGEVADTVSDAGGAVVDGVKDAGETVVNGVKKAGGTVANGVKDAGGAVVNGVKKAGGAVAEGVKDAGGAAADGVRDVVELSGEAASGAVEQAGNYAGGVKEWGQKNWDTVKGVVDNPRDALRGVDSLARFNPVYGIPAAAAEGKNPAEWLGDNYRTGIGVRDNVVEEYRNVRDEHGYAGVAGYLAPEVAIAAVTAGNSTAVTTGTKSFGRQFAGDVAPGPDDAVTAATNGDQNDRRWWEGALDIVA